MATAQRAATATPDRIVREAERRQITGLSRTHWWGLERDGRAPRRRKLSTRAVGWSFRELQQWLESRTAAQ
jgi:predicted DNA-binding transcriptional regulator AlpA